MVSPALNPRPLPATVIACVYIVMGAVGFVYHLGDSVWVELLRLAAIVCGAFMLRGRNWARWLLILWMAYHVVLSAYHSVSELIMHTLLMVVIAYFLLRPKASVYFRASRREVSSRA